MCTDRAVTRPSSEPVSMMLIVDRQTPAETLPSLAVGNKLWLQAYVRIGLHISFPDCSLDNSTTYWGYFKDNNLTAEKIVEHTNKDHAGLELLPKKYK